MHPNSIEFFYWAAGLVGHCVLLAVLFIRHRVAAFPFFTGLIAANIFRTITLYAFYLQGSASAYRVAYTILATLDFVLQLCVTYELASHVFRPTGTWVPDVRNGFRVLAVLSVVLATILVMLPTPPEKTLLKSVLDRTNLFSSALLSELFVGMIAFSVTANLPWKTHVARISQGLGFYSLIGVMISAGYNTVGQVRTLAVSRDLTLVQLTTYLMCLSYWTVTLWREAPAPRELPDEMKMQLFTLQSRVEYDLRKLRALKR